MRRGLPTSWEGAAGRAGHGEGGKDDEGGSQSVTRKRKKCERNQERYKAPRALGRNCSSSRLARDVGGTFRRTQWSLGRKVPLILPMYGVPFLGSSLT